MAVKSILLSLLKGKAAGPDLISNRILKDLAQPLSSPLKDLFNFSLEKGKFPIIWKQANVTPIFKKDDPAEISNYRQLDLLKINKWAKQWLVKFNPTKSESMIFSEKRNKPYHPPVFMNQTQIQEVTSHKHLGLIFSDDCTWHDYLDYIKTKAWNRINIMRKLKFKLYRHSLQTIFFSFIRPLLEYSDVVWDNCTLYEVNELEKIQNEAACIVTGATKLVSIDCLNHETGWELLASRRKKHKLQLFYKMQTNLTPDYLSF